MNVLEAVRAAAAHAAALPVFTKVDADLSAEAGMDGNLGRLLQAARNLDIKASERFKVGSRVGIQDGGGESPGVKDAEGGLGTVTHVHPSGYTVALDDGGSFEAYSQDVYAL